MRGQKQIVYVIKQRIANNDFLCDIYSTLESAKRSIKERKIKSIFIRPLFFIEKLEVKE